MPLFALSALLFAQAATPPAASPAAPPKPVKICRGGQRNLGTHMRSGRVCKTAAEWAAEKQDGSYIPSMTIRRTQDAPIEGLPRPACCL